MGVFSDFLSNVFSPVASIGIGIGNLVSQNRQNRWERQMFSQNLDYEKALQQEIFDREDTAYQRAVSDARKAGLSPLAISGGSSAGSVVSLSSAPSQEAGQLNVDPLALVQAVEGIKSLKSDRDRQDRLVDAQIDAMHSDNKLKWAQYYSGREQASRDIMRIDREYARRVHESDRQYQYQLERAAKEDVRFSAEMELKKLLRSDSISSVNFDQTMRKIDTIINVAVTTKNIEKVKEEIELLKMEKEDLEAINAVFDNLSDLSMGENLSGSDIVSGLWIIIKTALRDFR